jgi:CP family cyanate transporter-like MFS transporter
MSKTTHRFGWALASVIFITMLLRPPLAGIGPLLTQIQLQYNLNPAELGLLTSAPVFCFGVGAFAGPALVRWLGLTRSFTLILVSLTALIALRGAFGFGFLLVGTILLGLAIAVSNVLFPTLVQVEFPNHVARMTAVYTTALSAFSALASGISFPLSKLIGSWQGSLAVWAIPGVLGLVSWLVTARHITAVPEAAKPSSPVNVWKSPLAWALAGFFGLQSANFYMLLNWLPTILVAKGLNPTDAGSTLGVVSMIGIPVGMLITANLKRFKSLTAVVIGISAVTAVGIAGFAAPLWLMPAAVLLTGIGLASSFPLALALMAMKARHQDTTTSLSAMSQGIGYLVAAAGVFIGGLSFQLFHNWTVSLGIQVVMSLTQAFAGIYAAKHEAI